MEQKNELIDRLLLFAKSIVEVVETLPRSFAADFIADKLLRKGTDPFISYTDAQHSNSRQEFIDKLQIAANELRVANYFLRIVQEMKWTTIDLAPVLDENNHLIAILAKSVSTAKKNSIA